VSVSLHLKIKGQFGFDSRGKDNGEHKPITGKTIEMTLQPSRMAA
jgi:hypothetical protein